MLEGGSSDNVKRYAPPSQRNRLSRRKSGDRFEKINYSYGTDPEKIQASNSRNISAVDHREAVSNHHLEIINPGLIPIDGCCNSEAAELLNERWAAAMHSYNDPLVDLSERPVVYSGAGVSSWGHLKLPHQMDFLAELRRSMHATQHSTVPVPSEDN